MIFVRFDKIIQFVFLHVEQKCTRLQLCAEVQGPGKCNTFCDNKNRNMANLLIETANFYDKIRKLIAFKGCANIRICLCKGFFHFYNFCPNDRSRQGDRTYGILTNIYIRVPFKTYI